MVARKIKTMAMNAAKSESSKDDDVLAFWNQDDKGLPTSPVNKDLSPEAVRKLVVTKAREMCTARLDAYFAVTVHPFYWWEFSIFCTALALWMVASATWIVNAGPGLAFVSSLFNSYCAVVVIRLVFVRHVMKMDKRFTMGESRNASLHRYVMSLWEAPKEQRMRDQIDTLCSAVFGPAVDPAFMVCFGNSPYFLPAYYTAYDKLHEMHGLLFLNKSIEERAKLVGLRALYDIWGSAQGFNTK